VLDDVFRCRAVVLQHVLDQIDAPARRIELIAQQHIGRTGRGAEAAVHAGAQDFFGFRDLRIGELRQGEGGLHALFAPQSLPSCADLIRASIILSKTMDCRVKPGNDHRGSRRIFITLPPTSGLG
jgi:hypothetical protein